MSTRGVCLVGLCGNGGDERAREAGGWCETGGRKVSWVRVGFVDWIMGLCMYMWIGIGEGLALVECSSVR